MMGEGPLGPIRRVVPLPQKDLGRCSVTTLIGDEGTSIARVYGHLLCGVTVSRNLGGDKLDHSQGLSDMWQGACVKVMVTLESAMREGIRQGD